MPEVPEVPTFRLARRELPRADAVPGAECVAKELKEEGADEEVNLRFGHLGGLREMEWDRSPDVTEATRT
jgi:hypothetical protein